MQRPIKFRARGRDSNDWYYGYYVEKAGEATIIESSGYTAFVQKDTVGQYTGLKDKNGKECYEDDLIKIGDMAYRVEWNGAPNGAGFFLGMYKGSGSSSLQMYRVPDGEIVGNVYES